MGYGPWTPPLLVECHGSDFGRAGNFFEGFRPSVTGFWVGRRVVDLLGGGDCGWVGPGKVLTPEVTKLISGRYANPVVGTLAGPNGLIIRPGLVHLPALICPISACHM